MKPIVIDFETVDPYLKQRKLGSGWVYKIKAIISDYKLVGVGLRLHNGTLQYLTDFTALPKIIEEHDTIIAHNAEYDCGALLTLGINIRDKTIIDTVILAKLYRNDLGKRKYGLDDLGKHYLKSKKDNQSLIEAVKETKIYQKNILENKRAGAARKLKIIKTSIKDIQFPPDNELEGWIKGHMDLVQDACPSFMAQYCLKDVELTWGLFNCFEPVVKDTATIQRFSNVIKACLEMRTRGVRIDLNRAREVKEQMVPLIIQAFQKVYDMAGEEFNLFSCKDVPRILDKLEIEYPRNKRCNPTITSDWLEELEHPIGAAIAEAKKLKKLSKDFVQKIITAQEYTLGVSLGEVDLLPFGRIYPTLTILGATATGRFSSSGPNIQQIPKRDKEYGKLIRSMFIPEEGQQWAKLDYSDQEGRLRLHFAKLLNCKGWEVLVNAYKESPSLNMHRKVASLIHNIPMEAVTEEQYFQTKTIHHGLSNGMGRQSVCKKLGKSLVEGKKIINKFHMEIPYLKDLLKKCISAMQAKQYVLTLCKRKLYNEKIIQNGKEVTMDYKAISKVIQGSGADQVYEAISKSYQEDLPMLFVVHDEFNLSIKDISEGTRMKEIMETCLPLEVPVTTELSVGASWAAASFG